MHVMVLGAGLSGVTTAWYLTQAGFRVSLLDRQAEAVTAAHTRHGLRPVRRRDIGPWTTLVLRGRL